MLFVMGKIVDHEFHYLRGMVDLSRFDILSGLSRKFLNRLCSFCQTVRRLSIASRACD